MNIEPNRHLCSGVLLKMVAFSDMADFPPFDFQMSSPIQYSKHYETGPQQVCHYFFSISSAVFSAMIWPLKLYVRECDV
jgi:hypothetical protein